MEKRGNANAGSFDGGRLWDERLHVPLNPLNYCPANRVLAHASECQAFVAEGKYIADWMRAQAEVKRVAYFSCQNWRPERCDAQHTLHA